MTDEEAQREEMMVDAWYKGRLTSEFDGDRWHRPCDKSRVKPVLAVVRWEEAEGWRWYVCSNPWAEGVEQRFQTAQFEAGKKAIAQTGGTTT